jgi:hypothetical protein
MLEEPHLLGKKIVFGVTTLGLAVWPRYRMTLSNAKSPKSKRARMPKSEVRIMLTCLYIKGIIH